MQTLMSPENRQSRSQSNSEGMKGELYQHVVRRCLIGGQELRLEKNAYDKDAETVAAMHEVYLTELPMLFYRGFRHENGRYNGHALLDTLLGKQ